MSGRIYVIKNNDELTPMEETKHTREFDFQGLLEKYPDLIPGDQINPTKPRRWILVGREISIPIVGGGLKPIDHLFLDQDGIPTIVEVKRSENNELKRDVAAQILEYGTNLLLSMKVEDIKYRTEDKNIQKFLKNEIDEEEYWNNVENNIKKEKIRLLVVADEIPEELQTILNFLNRKIDSIEVLGVEIKQYICEENGMRTIVPRVIGQNIKPQPMFRPDKLDEEKFIELFDGAEKKFYEELFEFVNNEGFIIQGTAKSIKIIIKIDNRELSILQGFIPDSYAKIFSQKDDLKKLVNDGDLIAEKYVDETLKINGFEKIGDGFGYNPTKILDKNGWKEFKRILTIIKEEAEDKGLK